MFEISPLIQNKGKLRSSTSRAMRLSSLTLSTRVGLSANWGIPLQYEQIIRVNHDE
jgi:hypothetical protein